MYLDTVVVSGIIIMVLACVMMVYVGVFAYKHIKADVQKFDQQKAEKKSS